MLRLLICLYLGFASTAARASLQDLANEMSARREAQGAAIAAQAPLVEKAWACDAIFHPEKVVGWEFRQNKADGQPESNEESRVRLFKILVEFRGCPDKEDSDQMRKAFIDKYICDWNNWNGYFQEHKQMSEKIPEIIKGVKFCKFHAMVGTDYDSDLSFHHDRNEKFIREQELKLKKIQLKNGTKSVSSFDDAVLLYEPNELASVMRSPLLMPDKAIYSGTFILDSQESENSLRIKYGGVNHPLVGWVDIAYATIRISKKTINYSHSGLRIGGKINVIGRYVKNAKYTHYCPVKIKIDSIGCAAPLRTFCSLHPETLAARASSRTG